MRGPVTVVAPTGTNFYRWVAGTSTYSTDITSAYGAGASRGGGGGNNTMHKVIHAYKVSVSGTAGQSGHLYAQGASFASTEYMAAKSEL